LSRCSSAWASGGDCRCSALLPLVISFGQAELKTIAASVAGGLIAFYQIGYGIAAFGVGPLMRMLTRTAGVELAPHNILVVGVGPGAVATPINQSTMNDPALMKKLDAAIPIGRMARPEEIGSVVAFLAGDGASYLTATTIFADGGIMQSSPGL
jgi:NAD(P)-dependent dehydrogenase (short-subunit alcohol dehydrogenase family)